MHDLRHVSWVASVCAHIDPAQHFITAVKDLCHRDHDLSDLSNMSVQCVQPSRNERSTV